MVEEGAGWSSRLQLLSIDDLSGSYGRTMLSMDSMGDYGSDMMPRRLLSVGSYGSDRKMLELGGYGGRGILSDGTYGRALLSHDPEMLLITSMMEEYNEDWE